MTQKKCLTLRNSIKIPSVEQEQSNMWRGTFCDDSWIIKFSYIEMCCLTLSTQAHSLRSWNRNVSSKQMSKGKSDFSHTLEIKNENILVPGTKKFQIESELIQNWCRIYCITNNLCHSLRFWNGNWTFPLYLRLFSLWYSEFIDTKYGKMIEQNFRL